MAAQTLLHSLFSNRWNPSSQVVATGGLKPGRDSVPDEELYYIWGVDSLDARYVYLSTQPLRGFPDMPVMAEIGPTGLIGKISVLSMGREAPVEHVVAQRHNAFGNFIISPEAGSIDGIVDEIYERIEGLEFRSQKKRLFEWDYRSMARWFLDSSPMISGDIIPDYSDKTVPIRASAGCSYKRCGYCPESISGKNVRFDRKTIGETIDRMRGLIREFHDDRLDLFDEAFVSTSDILWFMKPWKTDIPDPIEIILMMADGFRDEDGGMYLRKRSTFVSAQNIIWLKENFDRYSGAYRERAMASDYKEAFARKPSMFSTPQAYLNELFTYYNRAYIGIETLDDRLSDALGKPITRDEKLEAIDTLMQTPAQKVKLIVQIGFGRYMPSDDGNPIDLEESIRYTARELASLSKRYNAARNTPRLTVEVSVYQPIEGTKVAAMMQRQDFVDYDSWDEAITRERQIFRDEFRKAGADIESLRFDYEYALPIYQIK